MSTFGKLYQYTESTRVNYYSLRSVRDLSHVLPTSISSSFSHAVLLGTIEPCTSTRASSLFIEPSKPTLVTCYEVNPNEL